MFDEELDKYETYEQYLDSLVSEEDHKYLQDEEMARAIAELGYRYLSSFKSDFSTYLHTSTLFENHWKCHIWIFVFWHFPIIFVLSKLTCLVTLFDHKIFNSLSK